MEVAAQTTMQRNSLELWEEADFKGLNILQQVITTKLQPVVTLYSSMYQA